MIPYPWIRFLYPCRCLCFGLEQMTRTTPSRLITLHLSHIFLTEARTFIFTPWRRHQCQRGTHERVRYKFTSVIGQFFHGPDRGAIIPPLPDLPAVLAQNSFSSPRLHEREPNPDSPASGEP